MSLADNSAQTRAQALDIAEAGLDSNTVALNGKHYVLAGGHQFHTLWVRDFSMSVPGLLAMGRTQAVHDTLETILANQRADGLLPRTIDSEGEVTRFFFGEIGLGIGPAWAPKTPSYITENRVVSIDENAVLPWAASLYVKQTHDRDFAETWFASAEKSLEYFKNGNLVDGLIGNQQKFSDWEDSVARTGRVAFTNELYILSLRGLSEWADFLGLSDRATDYAAQAADVQNRFYRYFWIPKRHILMNFEGDSRITADANLMAVAHQLVPLEDAKEIMDGFRSSIFWTPTPARTTFPNYPDSMKSFQIVFSGMAGYHDRMTWLWLSALAAQAERAVGNSSGCEQILDQLSSLIVAHHGVYEVYQSDNGNGGPLIPVTTWLYHSEVPFTWSSAFYADTALQGCY